MSGRPTSSTLGQSPFEIVAFSLILGVLVGIGVLWAAGVVIGSIIGSSLPGSVGEGMMRMVGSFPDIGAAWDPTVPSVLIWVAATALVGLAAPLFWRLARSGRLRDEGAQWATFSDLHRAGLLVADGTPTHSVLEPVSREEPDDEE